MAKKKQVESFDSPSFEFKEGEDEIFEPVEVKTVEPVEEPKKEHFTEFKDSPPLPGKPKEKTAKHVCEIDYEFDGKCYRKVDKKGNFTGVGFCKLCGLYR